MTVSSNDPRRSYNGDGSTTAFATPYFLVNADIYVYVDGVLQTESTHYTLTGAGIAAGGTVTMLTAPPTGTANVIILNDPALTQGLNLVENDRNPAESREQAFDKLTMIAQRLRDLIERAFLLPDTVTGVSTVLPTPEASTFVGWDAAATALVNYVGVSGTATSAFMATVLDDTSASIARTTLAAAGIHVSASRPATADLNAGDIWIDSDYAANTYAVYFIVTPATAGNDILLSEYDTLNHLHIPILDGKRLDTLALLGALTHVPLTTAGTSTAYTVTYGISAYETGRTYSVDIDQLCGDNPTINFDSIGAKSIYYKNGFPVTSGALLGPHQLYYDGTNMVVLDPLHVTMDLSAASVDYTLQPDETAIYSLSSATSKALHIGMATEGIYELSYRGGATTNTTAATLQPNNTTYASAIASFSHYDNGTTQTFDRTATSAFIFGYGDCAYGFMKFINGGTAAKDSSGNFVGSDATYIRAFTEKQSWGAATDWTSFGTLTFGAAWTGAVTIRRIR